MTLAQKMAEVLTHLRGLPKSREASLAITRLEESAFWAACAVEKVTDPIAKLAGQDEPKKGAS